jgi:hypothetical protein
VDLLRLEAARVKLDELVALHPYLTSRASQERLATHLDHADKDPDHGSKEDDEDGAP